MSGRRAEAGFTLVEMLISVAVMLLALSGLASLLIQNARINKAQRSAVETQANARNTLSLVVQKLRSAGWDPLNGGIATVALDADLTDNVSEIEVFADLDDTPDGATTNLDEQVLIRHDPATNQVSWRRQVGLTDFEVLAVNISNDADGDGTVEPMFTPDDAGNPTRITVQVTAQSPIPDPTSGQFLRYTVSSDVVFRKEL